MSYEVLALLFLLVGMGLLVLEFFIPSGGLVGLLSLIAFVVSVWSAKQAWYNAAPAYWYTYLITLIVMIPSSIVGMVRWIQTSEYGKRILLKGPSEEAVTPFAEEIQHVQDLIGERGTTESELGLSGICRINGERIECHSDGLLIEQGVRVIVTGHRGLTPTVRKLTPAELAEVDRPVIDVSEPDRTAPSDEESDVFTDPFASEDA